MSATLSIIVRQKARAFPPLVSTCWEEIVRYVVHRAAIARLRERDDRILHDIGLARSQIEAAVQGRLTAPVLARVQ